MTETEQQWQTHDPPWLAALHPHLVDEHLAVTEGSARTPEERAAYLMEQLGRAAAGRVPPALAGLGWRDADITEYSDEPAKPVMRARVPGPWPCQLPERMPCPECDRMFATELAVKVHAAVEHRRREPHPAGTPTPRRGGATKPRPGARTRRAGRRRRR